VNPLWTAWRGKGPLNLARRAVSIVSRYGLTSAKLDQALRQFVAVLDRYNCRATFPVTAVALARHPRVIAQYAQQGIEFAIHGYRHMDHCQLALAEQVAHLALAQRVFERANIPVCGFRGPYLHANADTLAALQQRHLAYDSSQGVYWDVLGERETPAYRHVTAFYGAVSANDYPALPSLEGDVVRLPYSLPDDEALAHRWALQTTAQMTDLWLAVLARAYELGELFTLGLHPERALICQEPLAAVLAQARQAQPAVWIARLDDIARWWRARSVSTLDIADEPDGSFRVTVDGPDELAVLARGVEIDAPTVPWGNGDHLVQARRFTLRAAQRPCLGIAPNAHPDLARWARQQGYAVEISDQRQRYTCYLEQSDFRATDQRPLLARLESIPHSLVRLGRWPNGARSALAVTGDIDALTLWDYAARFVGK